MKACVMVSIIDMEPETPGQEDVIASVHVVAEGTEAPSIATNAVGKAQALCAKMVKDDGVTPLLTPEHEYHSVVNILGVLPDKSGKQIAIPNAAATQAILKRGEIREPARARN
jgi:hypothetical protein